MKAHMRPCPIETARAVIGGRDRRDALIGEPLSRSLEFQIQIPDVQIHRPGGAGSDRSTHYGARHG
ncbi:hypothetical protein TRIP_B50602 [uncultured Desulfatiglans sp.]|nr:hypothetical protein TRIP_B50602 [uncultured Desulfatiglans sp.]